MTFAALRHVFGLGGTRAKALVGLATRIAAKLTAYTYALYVNLLLDRPQWRIRSGLPPVRWFFRESDESSLGSRQMAT